MSDTSEQEPTIFGETATWRPVKPKMSIAGLSVHWLTAAAAVLVTAWILPGISVEGFAGALIVAIVIGILNAVLPPLIAAIPIPLMALLGFGIILVVDAAVIQITSSITENAIKVDNFGFALLAALVIAAVTMVIEVVLGTNDEDAFQLRVVRRVARRQGLIEQTEEPGILFLEIDGLGYPVLQQALRGGSAPNLSRWLDEGSHELLEWETDLSSQTGASQAGILLGSNADLPAFRWIEKETGELKAISGPDSVVEVEKRHSNGIGILRNGGASRGNIFSGEADAAILTVARMSGEFKGNPG